jgi:uncharacterized RDD family membrane protein YckC
MGISSKSLDMNSETFENKPASAASISGKYDSSIIVNRWLGAWIDLIVLALFLVVPGYLLGNELYKKTVFIWLGLIAAYFPVLESRYGKSIGKFATRTRVVNSKGGKPSLGQSLVRTMFRLVEVNPLLMGGIPAGIAVLASKNKQRLGDMVAGTYVLRDKDASQIARICDA